MTDQPTPPAVDTSREAVESLALALEGHTHARGFGADDCMWCHGANMVRALLAEREAQQKELEAEKEAVYNAGKNADEWQTKWASAVAEREARDAALRVIRDLVEASEPECHVRGVGRCCWVCEAVLEGTEHPEHAAGCDWRRALEAIDAALTEPPR